jgi:hypothetical protein
MTKISKNLLCSILISSLVFSTFLPILSFPSTSRAADLVDGGTDDYDPVVDEEDTTQYLPSGDGLTEEEIAKYQADGKMLYESFYSMNSLLANFQNFNPDATIAFEDIFGTKTRDAKIILPRQDLNALRALRCMVQVMPDYTEDFISLYRDLPEALRLKVENAIAEEIRADAPKYSNYTEYFIYLKTGFDKEAKPNPDQNSIAVNETLFDEYAEAAEARFDNDKIKAIWGEEIRKLRNGEPLLVSDSTLACVTGLEESQIQGELLSQSGRSYLADMLDDGQGGGILNTGMIDIRIVKTLVYLVTPKDEGGAGHWRIRVRRILQKTEPSTESDAVIASLGDDNTPATTTSSGCTEEMTAAECGAAQEAANDGTAVTAEVTDRGGQTYEAYLQDLSDNEEDLIKNERNVSAHFSGQAVDISEVDDIRCTLVKKRRIGGDQKEKQPIRPIKLAWQTTDGWEKTRGQDQFDMMSMVKDLAKESIVDILASFDEGIDSYDGDLSEANFEDLVGVLGQSMLGSVLDAPNFSLKSISSEDLLRKLGAVYLADYLGLPRAAFADTNITDIEAVKMSIGQAAIEKRLGLPYGSLNYFNPFASAASKKPTYDLEGLILHIGQAKMEKEMGLNRGDLEGFVRSSDNLLNEGTNLNQLVGSRLIENKLGLPQNAWPKEGVSYSNLPEYVSPIKAEIFKIDPAYVDSVLGIETGKTRDFVRGSLKSDAYASLIGEKRLQQTSLGLKFFQANNSAYQMPGPTKDNPEIPDTWQEALLGKKTAFMTIGIYTLSRLLGDDALDIPYRDDLEEGTYSGIELLENGSIVPYKREVFGQYLFREWLRANLGKTNDDACKSARTAEEINLIIESAANKSLDEQIRIQRSVACPLDIKINYTLKYKDKNGTNQTKSLSKILDLPERKATAAGLESFDLYRMFSYASADGRAVFGRIGGKLLYYGIANRLLSKEERIKIELEDTDPTLHISNEGVGFYVGRVANLVTLLEKTDRDWKEVEKEFNSFEGGDALTAKIGSLISKFQGLVKDGDKDLDKVKAIITACREVTELLREIKGESLALKEYAALNATSELNAKIAKVNVFLIDVDELIRTVSELLAGKPISSSDSLTIKQIYPSGLGGTDQTSERSKKGLSSVQIGFLIFDFLFGKISYTDLALRIGANKAEGQLNLPANSLYYLIENFEERGIHGVDAFYQAIGQARIEEHFNMPSFYFQGSSLDRNQPDFANNMPALIQWAGPEIYQLFASTHTYYARTLYGIENPDAKGLQKLKSQFGTKEGVFKNFVDAAKKRWQETFAANLAAQGGVILKETTLDDIVANIKNRGFGDGIRSPENDLLFRMGLPTGNYDGLRENQPLAWANTDGKAKSIDRALGLNLGSTRSLFTGITSLDSKTLSNKEKNQAEASDLKIGKNVLEKYIMMVNQELLPSEAEAYNLTLTPDYIYNNPYATTATAATNNTDCGITYTQRDGFAINEATLESNSFCYYDNKGRHCFQSQEEAERFAKAHPEDQIKDLLSLVALRVTELYNQYNPNSKIDINEAKRGLADFVNEPRKASAFSGAVLAKIKNDLGVESQDEYTIAKAMFDKIANASVNSTNGAISKELLLKLFTRENVENALYLYKQKIGQIESQRTITSKIFDSLGFEINPELFDGNDLYDVITGDLSSLYRLGSTLVDENIGLKPGTTLLVVTAVSTSSIQCALDQAGGALLGGLVGLDYLPISSLSNFTFESFGRSIGAAKIEEALGFGRGTFRGNNLEELVRSVGPLNFVLALNYPVEDFVNPDYIRTIVGEKAYQNMDNTSDRYKLIRAQQALDGVAKINTQKYGAINDLDNQLVELVKMIATNLKAADPNASLVLPLPDQNSSNYKGIALWNKEVKEFYAKMKSLDSQFGLAEHSTYFLLSESAMTPNNYAGSIGNATFKDMALKLAADALGVRGETFDAYKTAFDDIKAIFNKTTRTPVDLATVVNHLDKLFQMHLDEKSGLPAGTIAGIITDPGTAPATLLRIGAMRVDQQLGLNPDDTLSLTGLYEFYIPSESAALDEACKTEYPDATREELSMRLAGAKRDLSKAAAGSAEASEAQGRVNSLTEQINTFDQNLSACKIAARNAAAASSINPNSGYAGLEVDWIELVIAEKIQGLIQKQVIQTNCVLKDAYLNGPKVPDCQEANVGFTVPLTDIIQMLRGDLRLLQPIAYSLTANYAFIAVQRVLFCHSSEQNGDNCRVPLPPELQVSFEEILSSVFGPDPNNLSDSIAYLSENDLSPDSLDNEKVSHGIPTGTGDALRDTINQYVDGNADTHSLSNIDRINRDLDEGYGVPADYDGRAKYKEWQSLVASNEAYCRNDKPADMAYNDCMRQKNYETGNPDLKLTRYEENTKAIRDRATDIAQKKLRYKIVDVGLWSLDKNIYAGFAEVMLSGNPQQRWQALSRYLANGLRNGEILGQTFSLGKDAEMWGRVALFAYDKYTRNDVNAFANFIDNGGYEMLADFLAEKSEDWFGFGLSKDISSGIITGLATGDWGLKEALSLDGVFGGTNEHKTIVGGKEVSLPTLGSAVVSFGVSKIFGWADKALGLPEGTSFGLAKMGYDVYQAAQLMSYMNGPEVANFLTTASKSISGAIDLLDSNPKLLSAIAKTYGLDPNSSTFKTDLANKMNAESNVGQTSKTNAADIYKAAKTALMQAVISIAVQKILGKALAGIEDSLGLVPGSLTPVVATAIFNAVAKFFAVDPVSWTITIALFVLTNLFGVYKMEYWCNADGYYPALQEPNYEQNDVTDLGRWGGKLGKGLDEKMQEGAIKAAQYKAKRLIGDILMVQYSKKFNDSNGQPLIPTQVMTGRKEDVVFWNNLITTNMCQAKLGDTKAYAVEGVCSGTRMGVWENPQTVAWTHIGF